MSLVIVILCVADTSDGSSPTAPHLTDVPGLQKEKQKEKTIANSLFIVLLCLYI